MHMSVNSDMTTGSVVSQDGTNIGYLRVGQGPAVILLHGSMQSARSHSQLALALADVFTVYLPDRRGRGMSGPYPADYGIRTEVADIEALMAVSGAQMIFGVSASGLAVLEAARTNPAISKVAVYEPALLPAGTKHTSWLPRFDREMAGGKVAAAMITAMFGLELAPAAMKLMPRPLLAALTNMIMKKEDATTEPDAVTMRSLAPTLHYEGTLLAEMAGTADTFSDVKAEVLLLEGGKGLKFLKPALDDLERMLPRSRRVEFPGLDHGAAADVSKANPGGKPEAVAADLKAFLAEK